MSDIAVAWELSQEQLSALGARLIALDHSIERVFSSLDKCVINAGVFLVQSCIKCGYGTLA